MARHDVTLSANLRASAAIVAGVGTVEPVWFEGISDKLTVLLSTVVERGQKTPDGQIVRAVTVPWLAIYQELERDPDRIFEFVNQPRKFEEFIATSYDMAGYDKVELTPASGDGGRDVIASKTGLITVRVLDQAKAYAPSRKVTANDVRAMHGVLAKDSNASKAVVTTTADFAPGVSKEFESFMPNRIELRNGSGVLEWLRQIADEQKA